MRSVKMTPKLSFGFERIILSPKLRSYLLSINRAAYGHMTKTYVSLNTSTYLFRILPRSSTSFFCLFTLSF